MTLYILFFFNDTATTEIYTLSLHDALPISGDEPCSLRQHGSLAARWLGTLHGAAADLDIGPSLPERGPSHYLEHLRDRKSTRLNSSHANISYAVFCLKKKKNCTHSLTNTYN